MLHVDGNCLLGSIPARAGEPYRLRRAPRGRRSIPARAGEPCTQCGLAIGCEVYPRACGGTDVRGQGLLHGWGLSPRVRGNHARSLEGPLVHGSIPARAGEPGSTGRTACVTAVYPRACGGTNVPTTEEPHDYGLSPRVRGNPSRRVLDAAEIRSIPARAGEPAQRPQRRPGCWVYPRACGEPAAGSAGATTTTVYPRACGGTA